MREEIETAKVPEPVAVAAPAPPPVEVAASLSVRRARSAGHRPVVRRPGSHYGHPFAPGPPRANRDPHRRQRHRPVDCRSRWTRARTHHDLRLSAADRDASRYDRRGRRKTPPLRRFAPACCRPSIPTRCPAGAVAAPLVTPAGCVGVMAAEIRHEGEREDVVLAAAGYRCRSARHAGWSPIGDER